MMKILFINNVLNEHNLNTEVINAFTFLKNVQFFLPHL
jgi:hypothetical protein